VAGGDPTGGVVRLLCVAAAAGADDWIGALGAAGFDVRAARIEDAAAVRSALRDPLDLVLAWDDAGGERAGAVLAAARDAAATVPVAVVGHPAAEHGLLRALDQGAAAGLEAGRPGRLPAELRRILQGEWLLTRIALTGRIAHDLNNLLAPIPLAVQLLQRNGDPVSARGQLQSVDAATRRSMDAVKELSELLVAKVATPLRVRAKHLLTLASRPWRGLPSGAPAVLTEYPPDLGGVRVDLLPFLQVLWCLARRAVDDVAGAPGSAGELLFSGRNLDRPPAAGQAGEVELRVVRAPSTAFAGQPEADPLRAPEPSDRLATILGMVEAQGGTLAVLDGPPDLAGYALVLPASRSYRAAEPPRPRASPPPPSPGRSPEPPRRAGSRSRSTAPIQRSVLVIEGDDEVRRMTRETLERSGWNVLVAEDGTEGVAVFAEHLGKVSAVLVDMTLPFMDGLATIKALRRIGDRVPMVLTTGGDWDPRRMGTGAGGPDAVLRKPYDAESLLQALGGGGGGGG
jgi:DNA-binding response OmpR family regulator